MVFDQYRDGVYDPGQYAPLGERWPNIVAKKSFAEKYDALTVTVNGEAGRLLIRLYWWNEEKWLDVNVDWFRADGETGYSRDCLNHITSDGKKIPDPKALVHEAVWLWNREVCGPGHWA